MELREIMEKKGLLEGLEEAQVQKLLSIGVLNRFEDGKVMIPEMTRSRDIYILGAGAASISMMLPMEGKRSEVIDTIHVGEIIGEIAFVDGSPRSATVKAAGDTEVYVFEFDKLIELLEEDTAIGYIFMRSVAKIISQKMRQANLAWRNMMLW